MALRKIILAVDCDDDNERDAVQQIAQEISDMRVLSAKSMLRMKPMFDSNRNELMQLFYFIANKGIKSLLSFEGGKLLMKFKK